ncbi:hypothetical protein B0J12DRAFT_746819 [Macrophomina phaseolina]|uniref:Uncharacterized protein n=1 Tax=Macrophomina phaseolina TaxID=35725 RepID=A0ABQ8FRG9_9PEZI|nr:hypothetical protein B0J12DRAFT_746819 [Macrophomina phaseolina]
MGDEERDNVDLDAVAKFLNGLIDRERAQQHKPSIDHAEPCGVQKNSNNEDNKAHNDASEDIDESWHGMETQMSMFLHNMDNYIQSTTEDSSMHNHTWMDPRSEQNEATNYHNEKIGTVPQSEPAMLESLGYSFWPEVPSQAPDVKIQAEAAAPAARLDALFCKLREKLNGLQEIEKSLEEYCAEMSSRHRDLAEQLTKLHAVVSDNAEQMQNWVTKSYHEYVRQEKIKDN